MKSITLTFTDVGDEVTVVSNLAGGFDKTSRAHQLANMALNYLDSVAARKEVETADAEKHQA